jgi:hypothetical protein
MIPDRPTWEERTQILGGYELFVRQCVQMIPALRRLGFKSLRLEIYHGEAAHAVLVRGFQQEAKYQQEIKSQPNN